jgi:transcriptional regulator with XRE-family HTH domain
LPKVYRTLKEQRQGLRDREYRNNVSALRRELKQIQKEQHITQSLLAVESNLGICTVSNILNQSCNFSKLKIESLKAVCDALGVRLVFSLEK